MDAGRKDLHDQENAMNLRGAMFLPVISAFFSGSSATLVKTIPLRPIFDREYISGTYSILAYVLSMALLYIPISLVQMGIFAGILQAFIGYRTHFGLLYLICWLLNQVGAAWGNFIAMATGSIDVASQILPAIIVPQIYLAGFYSTLNAIPAWVRWLQWVCGFKYGFQAITITEFHSLPGEMLDTLSHMINGNAGPNFHEKLKEPTLPADLAFNLGMLVALWIALRLAAVVALWGHARR